MAGVRALVRASVVVKVGVKLLVASAALVAGGVVAYRALDDGLVYYRTPQELAASSQALPGRLRVGGLVVEGSVLAVPGGVAFTLTDGVSDLRVVHTGAVSPVFAAGQGAIVEGRLDGRVFRSDRLMVKHSNEYRPPPAAATIAPAAAPIAPAAVSRTRVGLTEWAISARDPLLRPGPVSLEVTNAGATAHDLIVTGGGVSAHTPVLAPGQSATLRLRAPRGALLTLVCGLGGHEPLGMRGTLRVAT
ncbi:cytochrome c maturation protein CcmE domain-containing protein [Nonomuraea phyllanthi]|uniref:cytochrome c maturation protein CcmE domain-containing protein n=1 Tax=Nonomuraea phyllanthi TaxID=2219224 RepID=UPI001885278B|nr:cytochrome c maturation protein CcmE [Nonomuraea phyllanthi]